MTRCMSCMYATDRDRDEDHKFKCAFEDKWSGRKLLLHTGCIMHCVRNDCMKSNFLCHSYVKSFKGDLHEICKKCFLSRKKAVENNLYFFY